MYNLISVGPGLHLSCYAVLSNANSLVFNKGT